ncbi:MAG: proline--tRNA ligase [Alphaproteobacteria bacterium]|nr:proline--tRNA ligase [Alphaproteobacteria bacterium]
MDISKLLGKRYKEKSNEVKLKSHELLIRGGYIRPVVSGVFSLLHPGQRVLKKIENIVRQEINAVGGQEVEMPLVQPKELWQESGRYAAINEELVKLKDRNNHDMVLAMTHEEAAVALARTEATSYKDYPFSIYQFAKKFRDEARPRGGLIRVREFTMKDAYSFHRNQESLDAMYMEYASAYDRIFARVGIPEVLSVKSDSGIMGGSISHEYMLLTPCGEDTIITCTKCNYRSNKEVSVANVLPVNKDEEMKQLAEIPTMNVKTIEDVARFFGVNKNRIAKTVVYKPILPDSRTIVVMLRGDREVNENLLSRILKTKPELANDEAFNNSGLVPGFASGYKAHNVRIMVDESLKNERNLIAGANKIDFHIVNFNVLRDLEKPEFIEVSAVQDGDICKECGGKIVLNRGIEVGNIFQLGDKYTKPMKMTYTDENGALQTPIMGCYGIGIGRLMASVMEAKHDDRGPIWPVSIAPWETSIVALSNKNNDDSTIMCARNLYKDMQAAGVEVLFDGRNTSAGEKFADIDLLGIPLQFVISQRTLEQGCAEWKVRATGEKGLVDLKQVVSMATNWIDAENKRIMQSALETQNKTISDFNKKKVSEVCFKQALNKLER